MGCHEQVVTDTVDSADCRLQIANRPLREQERTHVEVAGDIVLVWGTSVIRTKRSLPLLELGAQGLHGVFAPRRGRCRQHHVGRRVALVSNPRHANERLEYLYDLHPWTCIIVRIEADMTCHGLVGRQRRQSGNFESAGRKKQQVCGQRSLRPSRSILCQSALSAVLSVRPVSCCHVTVMLCHVSVAVARHDIVAGPGYHTCM